jgi:hypothetical protein
VNLGRVFKLPNFVDEQKEMVRMVFNIPDVDYISERDLFLEQMKMKGCRIIQKKKLCKFDVSQSTV